MRAAVDTGGTFTDIIIYDEEMEIFWRSKVRSSPDNPEKSFIRGLMKAVEPAGRRLSSISAITHGTTIVTNSLLEGKVSKVGLIVTKGFKDILEIGRQQRPDLYDLMKDRKKPLVPRCLVEEVKERITATADVQVPLDKENARNKLKRLNDRAIEALAVVFLFSFTKPKHELEMKELAQKILKNKPVYLSSEISPEFREYERASTTVIAASVGPKVKNYLRALKKKLCVQGWNSGNLNIMHSGGGVSTPEQAAEQPQTLIESGPVAGLIGASFLSRMIGMNKVIAFDMGGTTAKAGMILDHELVCTPEYEVGGELHFSGRQKGSGYTVRTPMIDVVECGAGAGSIARIDKGGHVKVGPQSAGAVPGPACYGKKGKEPTVTDAHLILGRLSESNFLGGEVKIDKALAENAVLRRLCGPLKMGEEEAASGIIAVANASMLRILRLLTISRGYDPREFTLIAYGGAGPLHACELAEKMLISRIIIPQMAGLFSSLGLLFSDLSTDFVETVMIALEGNTQKINKAVSSLQKKADMWFEGKKVPERNRKVLASADMRLIRQNYELNIPMPVCPISESDMDKIKSAFHDKHEQIYGHKTPEEDIQVVNLRIRAVEVRKKPGLIRLKKSEKNRFPEQQGIRNVWYEDKRMKTKIYSRNKLLCRHHIDGPAVIEERESTTVLGPDWKATVDEWGNLVLEIQKK